jgi:thiamine-phosphate pyrophosphorylase
MKSSLPGTLRGLYAITPDSVPEDLLYERVAEAVQAGASIVQFREKKIPLEQTIGIVTRLATLCRNRGVPLIVNDNLELALISGAAGVHLGKDELGLMEIARAINPRLILGVSCYDSLERARTAVSGGADYVAFGSFFPSGTKPAAVRCSLEILRSARRTLEVPLVAIGGITPENGGALVEAGADYLAAISGVFDQREIPAAVAAYRQLFT